jgi:hypothetical protein
MVVLAKGIIIAFGLFFIGIAFVMLIKPIFARAILRKAGSTNIINYGEITLRMIPAAALISCAAVSKYPETFKLVGWFMLLTSLVLYFVPKKLHQNFSNRCADILKPFYFQVIAPFSMLIGIIIINAVL